MIDIIDLGNFLFLTNGRPTNCKRAKWLHDSVFAYVVASTPWK